jgi:hypothetical protein
MICLICTWEPVDQPDSALHLRCFCARASRHGIAVGSFCFVILELLCGARLGSVAHRSRTATGAPSQDRSCLAPGD